MTPPPIEPTSPSISEDELAEHLRRRGSGDPPPGLAAAIAERVAVERPEPRWRRAGGWRPPLAVAAALVIVVGAAFVTRQTSHTGSTSPSSPVGSGSVAIGTSPSVGATSSVPPSVGASPTASGAAVPAGTIVWPKGDLIAAVAAGGIPSGSVVVTDLADGDLGEFIPALSNSCPQLCPRWLLIHGGDHVVVYQSWLEPAPKTTVGRLGFLVVDRSLRLLGPVATDPDGTAIDLTPSSSPPGDPGTFTAVHGWLRDGPLVPCPIMPTTLRPPIGLDQEPIEFSCPWTWIQPTSAFPGLTNPDGSGSVGLPAGGLLVQNGADDASQTPREGVFLVRRFGCPVNTRCAAPAVPIDGPRSDLIGDIVGP